LRVCNLDALSILELPPLLQGASHNFIEAIATLDAQMLSSCNLAGSFQKQYGSLLQEQDRRKSAKQDGHG